MTKTQEFTTMEQLGRKVSATYGAVLQYGPLVLVTDTFIREDSQQRFTNLWRRRKKQDARISNAD